MNIRRHRPPGESPREYQVLSPPPAAGYAGDGRTTYVAAARWGGASLPGLPDADAYAIRAIPPNGHRAPRALPPPPPQPAQPRRDPGEAPLYTYVAKLGLWVWLCALCKDNGRPQARHADPDAQRAEYLFDTLRASARAAGWDTDAFGRWACPACQATPAFWPVSSITCSSVPRRDAQAWAQRRSSPAAEARRYGDTSGEWWHIIAADQAAFERARHARPGKAAVIIRPDGRFLAAYLIPGDTGTASRQPGRHRAATP